jgi:hypothetical protein
MSNCDPGGMHTNNMLKKLPTSSVVDGPPMFMKTTAVGPFELSCAAGGATVAFPLLHREACAGNSEAEAMEGLFSVARLHTWAKGARKAIARDMGEKMEGIGLPEHQQSAG